jgi:hypothetical protein
MFHDEQIFREGQTLQGIIDYLDIVSLHHMYVYTYIFQIRRQVLSAAVSAFVDFLEVVQQKLHRIACQSPMQ